MDSKLHILEELVDLMHLPPRRKNIRNNNDLRWLARNIGVYNQEHPNYPAAISLLKELLGERRVNEDI